MVFTIGASSAASAHANYARSEPAPNAELASAPTRVLIGFSEKYAPASSGLTLIDQSGREVVSGGQATSDPTELTLPLPQLSDGIYTVAWHTVSAVDGDAAKGYFAFRVGSVPSVSAPPATQTKTQDGITVSLVLSPAVPGKNRYPVTVARGSSPLPNVTRVRLRITPLDRDIGQSEIVLATASQPGQYAGSGFELPFAGRYQIEVQVRRSDTVDDLSFVFNQSISPAAASPSPSAAASNVGSTPAPTASPSSVSEPGPPTTTFLIIAGVVAVAVALGAWLLMRRRA